MRSNKESSVHKRTKGVGWNQIASSTNPHFLSLYFFSYFLSFFWLQSMCLTYKAQNKRTTKTSQTKSKAIVPQFLHSLAFHLFYFIMFIFLSFLWLHFFWWILLIFKISFNLLLWPLLYVCNVAKCLYFLLRSSFFPPKFSSPI